MHSKTIKRNLNILFFILFTLFLSFAISQEITVNAVPSNMSPKLNMRLYEEYSGKTSLTPAELVEGYQNKNNRFRFVMEIEAKEENVEIGVIVSKLKYDESLFTLTSTIVSQKRQVFNEDTGEYADVSIWGAGIDSSGTTTITANTMATNNEQELFEVDKPTKLVTFIFTLGSGVTIDQIAAKEFIEFGIQNDYNIGWTGALDHLYSHTNITLVTTTVGETTVTANPTLESINVLGGATGEVVTVGEFIQKDGTNDFNADITLTTVDSKTPLDISVIPSEPGAIVDITGNIATEYVPFQNTAPRSEINIAITHGGLTYNYKLLVQAIEPASIVNVLASLSAYHTIDNNLITGFSEDILDYTVSIPYSKTSVTIDALIPKTSRGSVAINGTTPTPTTVDSNDMYSSIITGLNEGEERIVSIVVTAEDGSPRIYKVKVKRENRSSETILNSLIIKVVGKTSINGVIMGDAISATIPEYDNDDINFYFEMNGPTTASNIRYSLDGIEWVTRNPVSGKASFPSITSFPRGSEATILIEVTAENGIDIRKYTLNLSRDKSSNTSIERIDVKQGESTPSAATRVGDSFTYVSSGTGGFEIFPIKPSTEASTYEIRKGSSSGTVVTGVIDYLSLSYGDNFYYIIVTAANGITTKEYSINLYKRSTENELVSYVLYDASNNNIISDNWTFDGIAYKNSFAWYKESPKINLVIETSDKSIISFSGGVTFTYEGLGKNQVSIPYTFIGTEEKSFSFTMTVAAEDSTAIKTYNFLIIQNAADTEARLQSITVGGIPVAGFDPDIYYYNDAVVVARALTDVQIITQKHTNSKAAVTITYNGSTSSLIPIVGPGVPVTVTIVVTPQSGTADKMTYIIKIVAGDNNNEIINAVFSGIDFSFDSSAKTNTITSPASVANTVLTITTPGDYNSKVYIKVNSETPMQINERTISLVAGLETTVQVYVISESGVKGETYVFKLTRTQPKSDKLLATLEVQLDGVSQTLIPLNNPDIPGFNPNIFDYQLRVDYVVKSLNVLATVPVGQGSKIVSGNGQKTLTNIKSTITVYVAAEDGTQNKYEIEVTKADDDNLINRVIIGGKEYDISSFIGGETDIYKVLTIPEVYSYTIKELSVQIITNNQYATLTSGLNASNNWVLKDGVNSLEFYATSQAGRDGQKYRINLERTGASTNALLDNLTIKDSGSNVLDIGFIKTQYIYTLRVNNTMSQLTIEYAAPTGANVTGDIGVVSLVNTVNTFKVVVTAQDGVTKVTYTITVYKTNDNKEVNDILVDDISLIDVDSNPFNPTIFDYNLGTFPYSKTSIKLGVSLSDPSAVVRINGEIVSSNKILNLTVGINTITIVVKSQYENEVNGEGTTYTITLVRSVASTDNSLTGITVNGITVNEFDQATSEIVYLASGTPIAKVEVQGLPAKATVTYDGSSNNSVVLSGNIKKTITVAVTAEDGTPNYYYVIVQAANTDNTITNLILSGIDFDYEVGVTTYTITSPAALGSTILSVITPGDSKSKVYIKVNGESLVQITEKAISLLAGAETSIQVYAESESGVKGETYLFKITRAQPRSEKLLETLVVNLDGVPQTLIPTNNPDTPGFNPNIFEYQLRVDFIVKSLNVTATVPVDKGSKITSGIGQKTLTNGKTTITVTVTAEDGSENKYEIEVTKADDDNLINTVIVGGKEYDISSFIGDETAIYKVLTIPEGFAYSIKKLNVQIITNNQYATLTSGLNTSNEWILNDGVNSLEFYATSQAGRDGQKYRINLERTVASNNAYLDDLNIKDSGNNLLDFGFNPTKLIYTLRVDNTMNLLTIAYVKPDGANVAGDVGSVSLINKVNTFKVSVVAEDQITKVTYTITVYKTNDNKEVSDILVDDISLVDVDSNSFNPTIFNYNLGTFPYSKTSIKLGAVLTDPSAVVRINGEITSNRQITLGVGPNTITIVGKSEYENEVNGEGITYTITLVRSVASTDNSLTGITVNEIAVEDFDKATSKIVYLTSGTPLAVIEVQGMHAKATVTYDNTIDNIIVLSGNIKKTVNVKVTSEDGLFKSYYVNIQAANTDNTIDNILLSGIDLSIFTFDKDVKTYTIEVPYAVASTTVTVYKPGGVKSVITGGGIHSLTANASYKIVVYATSEAGIEGAHYEIIITRKSASSDTNISSLQIYKGTSATPANALLDASAFDPEENSYELRVNNDVKSILIAATKANQEIVSEIGIKSLELGLNKYQIKITAEDGLTTRTINIRITKANDNNNITDIIIDGTSYSRTPNGEIDEIILLNPLPYSKKTFNINGVLEDISATMFIDGKQAINLVYSLKDGQNKIIIYAVSEFGTKSREIHISYFRTLAATDTSLDGLTVQTGDGDIINFDNVVFDPSKQDYVVSLGETDIYKQVIITASTNNAPFKVITGQLGLQTLNWSGDYLNHKLTITVTAENGDTKTYSVTFLKNSELGSNTGINSFTVTDTSNKSYLVFLDDGTLNRGMINLPYSIDTLIFNLETIDKNSSVKWENGKSGYNTFKPGETITVYFQVVAQDGTEGLKYYFEVYRELPNADISSVKVDGINIDLGLFTLDGNGIYVYNLDNVVYPKELINIEITSFNSKATITGAGIKVLGLGINTFSFYATAEDGTTLSDKYEIVVYKEARTENEIEDLYIIVDGKKILIDPIQDINTIIVGKEVSLITIGGNLPGGATTDGFKEYLLSSDSETFEIKITSESGDIKIYKFEIQRKSNNTNIDEIVIDGVNYDISDFKNNMLYLPNVTWSKKDISVLVKPSDVKATVVGNGTILLSEENNSIKFNVVAEDKTVGEVYTIIIYRDLVSNDATLKDLFVEVNGVKVDFTKGLFNPNILAYTVAIDRNVSISIKAFKNHLNANLGGYLGTIDVADIKQGGSTELTIHVTAEDGITKLIYKINVEAKSNVAKVNDIVITDSLAANLDLSIPFDNTLFNYTLNDVLYSNSFIIITSSLSDTYAHLVVVDGLNKVVDANSIPLNIGKNDFTIYALAEDGISKSDEYHITINRLNPDNNNLLESLSVTKNNASGALLSFDEGVFEAANNYYTIFILKTDAISNVYVHAKTQSETSSIAGDKIIILSSQDSNLLQVEVTSESGTTNTYFITIVRGGTQDTTNDASVLEVKLLDSKANNYMTSFNKTVSVQTPITVPYNVNSLVLIVTSYPNATIIGNGTYELVPGVANTITFQVTSEDGNNTSLLYSVVVTRSNPVVDNNLDEIYVDIINIDGELKRVLLDPEKLLNEVSIGKESTGIIIGGSNHNGATITGLGEYTIDGDEKVIKLKVTSPNNDDKEYIIKVYKQSNDTNLLSVKINGQEKILNFVNGILDLGNLPYSNKTINIVATAKDQFALVNGDATTITVEYALTKIGLIEYNLFVLAEDRTIGPKYTVRLNRMAPDNNAKLSSLEVKDNGTSNLLPLNPAFNPAIYKYSIDLTQQSGVKELLLQGVKASDLATLSGNKTYILKTEQGQSTQTFIVSVTAEDGSTTNNYEILVTREVTPDDDNTINEISLVGSDSINYLGINGSGLYNFELSKYNYFITVPYNVKNVTLYISNDNGASPYGIGRHDLTEKTTVVEFYMVSKSMNPSNTYTITIIQDDPSSDNLLKNLTIDGKTIDNFDPNVLEYTIDVVSEKTTQINLGAIAKDPNSLMTGDNGIIELPNGKTQWRINVRAENGELKTYTINVNRLSGNNAITDISINSKAIDLSFDVDKLVYYINVPYLTTTINLNAYKEHSMAVIEGTGLKTLNVGSNYFPVYATAENGDKGTVYQVEVNREAPSNISSLKLLDVYEYEGGPKIPFNNEFSPTTLNYIINLEEGNQLNSIWIDALATSQYARGVTGTGFKWLKAEVDGLYHTVLEVMVIAEDGITTTTYTISFYREVELSKVSEVGELALIGSDGIDYLGTDGAALKSFNRNTLTYTIKVPFNLASIALNVAAQPASVYGAGSKSFGSKQSIEFQMYIVSQDGSSQSETYTIIVEKEVALTSNKLSKILINEEDMLNFNPDVNQYEITLSVQKFTNILITAIPEDSSSVITGDIGGHRLIEGTQTFTLIVTAQNGINRTYSIIVNYVQSNALLEELQVNTSNDSIYNPEKANLFKGLVFDPVTFEYVLKVEKSVRTINISGAAQDLSNALVIGFGTYEIDDEGIKVNIFVQSADGKQLEKYILNIIKEDIPSKNSKLQDLKINNGEYKLTFDPNVMSYTITVKNGVTNLDIEAISQDPNAIVSVTGADQIDVGKNVLMVLVQAEDGSVSFYQVSVIRDFAPDYFLLVMLIVAFLVWILTVVFFLIFSSKRKRGKRPVVI